jgi:hypothetical protein
METKKNQECELCGKLVYVLVEDDLGCLICYDCDAEMSGAAPEDWCEDFDEDCF